MSDRLGKLLPVVNRSDQELGLEFSSDIHRLGLMHRAVHVLVFDRKGRVYLQKRSPHKSRYPGCWTSSASGHVEEGESYLNAAYRELHEELSLVSPCRYLGTLTPQLATDQAFVKIYGAFTSVPPQPDPVEISQGAFFTKNQAWNIVLRNREIAPVLRLVLALAGQKARGFRFARPLF